MNHYNGECRYGRCWLPKDNKKYLWQVLIIALSIVVLFVKEENFTFFPLFLFVSPVMLDIVNTELKSRTWNAVRVLLGILNALLLFFSLLGFAGVLNDNGSYFELPSTFMFLPGLLIKKKYISIAATLDIAVPIILWISAPCQAALRILEEGRTSE